MVEVFSSPCLKALVLCCLVVEDLYVSGGDTVDFSSMFSVSAEHAALLSDTVPAHGLHAD